MSRLVFALVVPALAVLLGAILLADLIGMGFAGEGCRHHMDNALRWAAAGETALVQVMFGLLFGLTLAVLVAVFRRRGVGHGSHVLARFETALIVGFLIGSAGLVVEHLGCRLQPYFEISKVLIGLGSICFLIAAIQAVIAYVRGLTAP